MFLSKYGVARHIYIPIPKAGSANHAVSADWTPAAGDVKISKDGGAAANVTNLPTAIAMGNSTVWDFSLTATEMQAAQIMVTVADSATKAVDDTGFIVETYGNASAQHAFDLGTASTAQTADVATLVGALNGAASSGDPGTTNTVVQMLKQLINTLEGTAGIPTWPNAAAPANAVSLAEAIRSIYTQLGVAGAGLTNVGDTRMVNLDAAVSSRMATYTQPTGFLSTDFGTLGTNASNAASSSASAYLAALDAANDAAAANTRVQLALPAAGPGSAGGVLIAGSNEATTFDGLTVSSAFLVSGGVTFANTGTGKALNIVANGSGSPIHIESLAGTCPALIYITSGGGSADGIRFVVDSGSDILHTGEVAYATETHSGATTYSGPVTANDAGNDITGIDVAKISGDSGAADNAESFFDGTGYAGTNNVIPTVSTLTNKSGFALASTGLDLPLAADLDETKNGKTLMAALNAARAQGFGKWTIVGTSLNLYASDGTTIVKTFTLDDASAPTSRS